MRRFYRLLPNPRFLRDMGIASIVAGFVLLGLARVAKLGR